MPPESVSFDRAAEFYDDTRGFPPGVDIPAMALAAKTGKLTTDSRVIEVGIGTGRIAAPLSTHTGLYTGVDISAAMLGKIADKAGGERVHPAQADATMIPFPDATFDAAVAVHIFHLIPTWQQALAETARVLKPEGVLLSCFNHSDDGNADMHLKQMHVCWRDVTAEDEGNRAVGVQPSQFPTYLSDNGWQQVGERQSYGYEIVTSVAAQLERLRGRISSSLWRINDDVYARGLAAVEDYVAQNVDDVNAPITTTWKFSVEVYGRP